MTDASDVAIGAVVEQDGRPLAFFSQSLTPTQKVWPVYEREAYAIFKALERFRPLLWGYHLELVVFSDHKPLEWIQTATTAKVQRWLISMSQFKFKVFYKKGKHNVVADALSRITTSDDKVAEPDLGALQRELQGTPALVTDKLLTDDREADVMEKDNFAPACVLTLCEQWSTADLVREQELDPVLRVVRDRVRRGEPLAKDELKDLEYRPYRRVWLTLRVHDSGLLVRRVQINEEATSRYVPVVPEGLRRQALDRFHEEAGHFRREHMVARLRRTAYWPGMSKDISEFLLHCEGCAPHKNVLLPHLPYVPYPVGSPWHTVAIDFLTVAPSRSGVSKLLVVVDHFTRWAEAVPVAGESAAEALKALLYLFSIHGPPVRILSDQGSAFEAQLFKDVLAQLGIAKSRTSVYHPNANGHVERFNSTILNLLRTHVTRVDTWQDHLRSVLWAYNTTPHSVTGYAPFFLMYGREPPTLFFPALEPYVDYVFDPQGYQRHLSRIRACIEDNVDEWVTAHGAGFQALKEREKIAAARRHFVGQRVRLRIHHPNNLPGRKLLPKWQLNWYIAKFVPGTHLKTVVLRHYPSKEEKVISTDYIVPDPVQPADVPVELGIVRLDPPVEEGPRIEQFPFRDELVRSAASRRSARSSVVPDVEAPANLRLVDIPYVYDGDDLDPLAERRDDLLPRLEAPSSGSAQVSVPRLETPIPVPVQLGSAVLRSPATSGPVPQDTGRSGPTVVPAGSEPSGGSPSLGLDSASQECGASRRSLPFSASTPTHVVSAPAADFEQLLGHSGPSSRQTLSAPSALIPAQRQQLLSVSPTLVDSGETSSSSLGSGLVSDAPVSTDPSRNTSQLVSSSSITTSSGTDETLPLTRGPDPAPAPEVQVEEATVESSTDLVIPDEIPTTPALETSPAATDTPVVSARSGGSTSSVRTYADVLASSPEQVEDSVAPRRSMRTPRPPTRFSPERYTSRGGYAE
ncbi:retrovirus polyprotein, putative [Perkinsus marinus ATCC 50983]|uniref:Retrovirus polyprotein, putative n=1 Tax=Perkinsus marinus (strain ATCC 50983 / TXsc) TaxID=423536 RepID=C5LHK7_PERM5|nr:retrovirus polyprotein, putative [Perkinsus marinus ATCC 50983]EER03786.1 retrovirus polyprotein, putative [Perkinsus marinus ATCC 50983]|eukprot:XP_002771970.1 retrovirus polyprotein, putative [Perkinsus marinus ATCC 50983]